MAPPHRSRAWTAAAVVLAVVLLVVASFTIPIPIFYGQLPGPIQDVERLVEVEGRRTYSSEGAMFMTTVTFDTQVTLVEWIAAAVDPTKTVVERDQITGGMSFDQLERIQLQEMRNSQSAAIVVAATALGADAPQGAGATIAAVIQEPAEGELERDDRIVAIDGSDVDTVCDVYALLHEREPGDTVGIKVVRGSAEETFTLEAASNPVDPGQAFLGIVMRSDYDFEPGFEVNFDTGRVAGPSAGLMLSLGLYDRLTPEDLTEGRSIAGTGTIMCDGSVGPIGGIEQKIAAAEARGADAFLTPTANVPAARSVADDIEIVEISSFDDALAYLQGG
jgi:Lon-like protease